MKKVKILTTILAVVLVTMVAFLGIYSQVQNRMENKVRDYSYTKNLKGARLVKLKVNEESTTIIKDENGKEVEETEELTDEQIAEKGYTKEEVQNNSEEVLTTDNYKKSKEIIEKRLKNLNVNDYSIKLDEQTGEIIIEYTENDNTDKVVSSLGTTGKFQIIDSETKEVLMTNDDIKSSNVMYGSNSRTTTNAGTTIYLNIEFNKEGAKKLEDISNKYVKTEETSDTDTTSEETTNTENTETENTETENTSAENTSAENASTENASTENASTENTSVENTNTEDTNVQNTETEENKEAEKTITMKVDDQEIMSTSFEEPLVTGQLQLSIGQASTDKDTLNGYVDQALSMATVLDSGNIPIKYDIAENEYISTDITEDNIQIIGYVAIAIIAIALVILCIRYKTNGIIGAILYIGLLAIYTLLIRYTNVEISLEGLFAIGLILIFEYIFINKILNKIYKNEEENNKNIVAKEAIKTTYKEFFIRIIPIIIAIIVFCFMNWIPLSSFGMIMFWGIALIAIYNFAIVGTILKIKTEKK